MLEVLERVAANMFGSAFGAANRQNNRDEPNREPQVPYECATICGQRIVLAGPQRRDDHDRADQMKQCRGKAQPFEWWKRACECHCSCDNKRDSSEYVHVIEQQLMSPPDGRALCSATGRETKPIDSDERYCASDHHACPSNRAAQRGV